MITAKIFFVFCLPAMLLANMLPAVAQSTNEICVTVSAKESWQEFPLPFIPREITKISGKWSVNHPQQKPTDAAGYPNLAVVSLEARKYDQAFPLGGLLIQSNQYPAEITLWVSDPTVLPVPPRDQNFKLRINVADRYLRQNDGNLQVCLQS